MPPLCLQTQLVVGTSAGLVVVYRLADATEMSDASSPSSAPAALSLIPALQVWAGSSPVQLSSLKHPETGQVWVLPCPPHCPEDPLSEAFPRSSTESSPDGNRFYLLIRCGD